MKNIKHHIRISPENVRNDIFGVTYIEDEYFRIIPFDPCCTTGTSVYDSLTGVTYAYSSLTEILSGGTNGDSLLTDLSIPIFLSENYVDIGFYSVLTERLLKKTPC